MFCKKGVLRNSQNLQEKTCARVSFLIKLQTEACNFINKETLAQVFSCEFCEISKNTFFYRGPPGDCFCNFCFLDKLQPNKAQFNPLFVHLDRIKKTTGNNYIKK